MKKIVLSVIVLALILVSFGDVGTKHSNNITFNLNSITAADTVLFVDSDNKELFMNGGAVQIEVEYSATDTTDATITVGSSLFGYTFNNIDTTDFPYTLDGHGDTATVNGYVPREYATRKVQPPFASKSWIISTHPGTWLPIKLTKGSTNTNDTIFIRIRQLWSAKGE